MPEETVPAKRGFIKGHPRFGGKKKGTSARVRDLVEQLGAGADPIRFLLLLIRDKTYQSVVIDAEGKKKKITVAAPLDLLIDSAKAVAQYYVPKLSAVAHTGSDGEGPVETVSFNLTAILSDPQLCEAAQKLAIAMADSNSPSQQIQPIAGLLEPGDGK